MTSRQAANFDPLAIRAAALLTPLDDGHQETWAALCAGQRIGLCRSVRDCFLEGDPTLDRSIRQALAAARRALQASPTTSPQKTTLFCATSKGPILTWLQACQRLRQGQLPTTQQAHHLMLGTGAMAPILARELGLSDAHTSVAACASGLHALHRAACELWQGECQRALVVAADASLHDLFEASFDRLGVLSPLQSDGTRRCEPFDEKGSGFFLTEAAAALVLERADAASSAAPPPLAWLQQSLIAADSTALIAIDPQTRTLRHALRQIAGPDIPAFIHAHATGTTYDRYERAAIESIFGKSPHLFTCKKNLGHSLGAASLVSIALSALAHHHAQLPTGEKIPPGANSLTIAQGFGGHIGIIKLSR